MSVEDQLREHLRRGIEWLQADDGQDQEAWISHHGIHGGKWWELDGFRFGLSLAGGMDGVPLIITTSVIPYPMSDKVWDKIRGLLRDIGVEAQDAWRQTGHGFSAKLGGVRFGKAYLRLLANYGTQFCPECPEKQKRAGHSSSTFCQCEFLAERAERVVYPEGWG